ncbi:AAA family ATPase [Thiobacillus sp.]|uniref:ATP-dependent nuclease n=1 Tax=Thiobacillus sp. TaxID=924 RepID=UPI0011D89030|nr:AAA family ATPase [Thiobacillus sp.]TXH76429.1 MAG: hypothetical protein E6Q82_03490 [Thiobacillus sp.]
MRYTYFEIKNFKGIEQARLDLNKTPCGRVYTLIGLNESGKTTILEAIDLLSFRDSLDALQLPGYATQKDIHELIPVSKRANFNEKISVAAGIELDAGDQKLVRDLLKKEGVQLVADIPPFQITQYYEFESSRVKPGQPKFLWNPVLKGRTGKQRKETTLTGEPRTKAWNIIKTILPRVVYFPNFLFEFPDKIYLENAPSADEKKNAHYREVLQDVLDAIGNGTNLDQHVLARAKSGEEPDKKSLQSVLLAMSGHITKTVFDAWENIFHRADQNKRRKEILVSLENDPVGWYLKLSIKDNNELYEISERSLGFRWFFAYLLLTQYRGFRSRGSGKDVIFLLDEPASNLHSSAQAQLLESFSTMTDKCSVIYTTHSHHLINPAWLENACVVRNEGLHYTDTDDDYTAKRTTISLHRYRDFAVRHPDQTTYFRPVLDVLDYSPSRLENIPDVVMLEGKNDYYTLRLMKEIVMPNEELNMLPGAGSGSLDSVIQLYLAWGRNFIVLLDSDDEGELQKKRYAEKFGSLVEPRVFTLADINPDWKKYETEKLLVDSDRLQIQKLAYPETDAYKKTHFNRAVQELLVLRRQPEQLQDPSRENFLRMFRWMKSNLSTLSTL